VTKNGIQLANTSNITSSETVFYLKLDNTSTTYKYPLTETVFVNIKSF